MEVVNDASALCESGGEDRHDLQNTQPHGVRGRASEQGGDAPVPEGQAAVGGVQDAKGNQGGRRAGHPEADALIEEMTLILALQDEMKSS